MGLSESALFGTSISGESHCASDDVYHVQRNILSPGGH